MNIHLEYKLMRGINYGCSKLGVARQGFHRSPVDPCQKLQRQQWSPNLMYMSAPGGCGVGWWVLCKQKGERLSKVHTWVCLVPDDLDWDDPFNNEQWHVFYLSFFIFGFSTPTLTALVHYVFSFSCSWILEKKTLERVYYESKEILHVFSIWEWTCPIYIS